MTVDSTLNEGPDQVAPAESYTSCDIRTPVKLRIQEEGDQSAVPISIPTLLRNTAERWPKRKALCVKRDGKWQSWTFQEYNQLVRTAAKSFIKLGLQPFQGVAIMGFNAPEYFIANMGAILAGGVSTGMYTTSSEATCKFYLNNTHISVVVVENDKYLQKILNVRDQCPYLTTIVQYTGTPQAKGVLSWSEFLAEASSCDEESLQKRLQGISVNQCASIIYTSGTTGDPKGVMVSHDIFTWVGAMGASKHSFHDGHDTMISYLPLSHGAAQIVEMYAALTAATTIYFAQPDALKGSLLNTLYEIQPTLFMGVPRIWEKMYEKLAPAFREGGPKMMLVNWCRAQATKHWEAKEKDPKTRAHPGMIAAECLLKKIRHKLGMSQVRSSVTTAAPISEDVVSFMHSLNIPVFEMYGLSETCGPSTTSGADGFRTGSIGHVFAGCQIKIHEPDSEEIGELLHRGRNTCMGYVNREADTAEAIDGDGWMHTGDLARIDKDGYVYIEGRLKELLITAAGKNIAPVPIEGHIKSELPLLSNVMVVGDRKKFLSALLTAKVEMDVETGNPTDKLLPEATRWLSERGVQAETVPELLENINSISPHIQAGIDAANQKAECHASWIQKWRFLPREFSIPGGELGPTLKLKRRTVLDLYQDIISDIYNS